MSPEYPFIFGQKVKGQDHEAKREFAGVAHGALESASFF